MQSTPPSTFLLQTQYPPPAATRSGHTTSAPTRFIIPFRGFGYICKGHGREKAGRAFPIPKNWNTLLSSIRMGMPPVPVGILVAMVRFYVLVVATMVIRQIDSPGTILIVIPIMIVLVVAVIDPHLDSGAFGRGNSHDCQRTC